jgi:hypothetical protein
MSDPEFDSWVNTLSDAEYDEFERYMDDMDLDSDTDAEAEEAPRVRETKAPSRPEPIRTNPNPAVGSMQNPIDLLGEDYFRKGSRERDRISEKDLKLMAAQMAYGPKHVPNYGDHPRADSLKKVHEEAIRDVTRRQMGKEIELFGGDCFRLIPSWPKRECIFIVGQQGAGKSWIAGRYIREWKKQHPDGKVIVFSQVAEDKELDKCGITRVMIDDGLVENPYEIKELANCLVVFDDIDAIRDKKIKKVVTDLCDELQVVGRHDNTWVIRTSHLFRNWGTTRASLAEANKTIFFPQVRARS